MAWHEFTHEQAALKQLAQSMVDEARQLGASDAVVEVSESCGLSVNVRMRKVETIEQTRDRVAGVTVYLGQKRGNASTSDLSADALADTVRRALDIARYTAEDPAAGLPEPEELAKTYPTHLDLYHPWTLTADDATAIAIRAEAAAFASHKSIKNSDGASVGAHHGQFVSANSRGFCAGYRSSRHSVSVAPIARRGQQMQRDFWYTTGRVPGQLESPELIGEMAAARAQRRLGAKRIPTQEVPVLFDPNLACGLLGSFVQAASGGALYRKSSFLVDHLGAEIFPSHVQIDEDPHVPRALGSAPFDEEGVQTRARSVVSDGVLAGYFLSVYSARKLGMKTTGNAGGSHNLTLSSRLTRSDDDFAGMLRRLDRGLLVTELMGQGVNYVTGDYSRGVFGFWVENGQIVHPVEEVTIASNLKDMFKGIVAVGNDVLIRGTKITGSILIDRMTVAGG